MKQWIKRLRSYFAFRFDIRFVRANIACLQKLLPGDCLTVDRQGLLSQGRGLGAELRGALSARWIRRAVEWSFLAFCHEVANPLTAPLLDQVRRQKAVAARRALRGLQTCRALDLNRLASLSKTVDQYERQSWIQRRIIRSVERATTKGLLVQAEGGKSPFEVSKPSQGCSGSYFVEVKRQDADPVLKLFGKRRLALGVYKPFDEEIGGPNNPRGPFMRGVLGERSSKLGLRVGENIHREVAAYRLDCALRLGLVPPTHYARLSHADFFCAQRSKYSHLPLTKRGSYQEFRHGYSMSQRPNAEDLKSTHPHEIHSLLLLDYLIGNTDRHQQNLLLQEGRIAAIDNGRSFGDRHVAPSICYKTLLPHMEMPIDPSLIDKVVGLPVTRVRAHLKARCFLEEAALQRFEERYALLRSGLEAGLLPVDLVELFTYERLDKLAQASRPELASAAQRAVADYAQNGRGQLRRERERVWTQSLRLRPDSEPLFWPFEVLPPLCEEELDGSFKGSLYGVGSGMVYHYLRGFSNGPERLVLVDSDPQQVLANRLLHCAFEAYPSFDEAGRYFFTPWMRGKTPYLKEASLSFGEKKRCGREAKLLAQRFKRAVQAGFVESRSPQLRRKKGQHPLFALSRSWNVLHRLAKEKKIEVRLADPLDASLLAQAAGDTAIFFFGHLAERIAKVRMASDGAPESVRALIRFLNEEALKGLGGGKTSPRPLLIAETTSAHRHWLRHHHGLPQWQVSDLYAQV